MSSSGEAAPLCRGGERRDVEGFAAAQLLADARRVFRAAGDHHPCDHQRVEHPGSAQDRPHRMGVRGEGCVRHDLSDRLGHLSPDRRGAPLCHGVLLWDDPDHLRARNITAGAAPCQDAHPGIHRARPIGWVRSGRRRDARAARQRLDRWASLPIRAPARRGSPAGTSGCGLRSWASAWGWSSC